MRITEDERTGFSKFRNVSDLRVQFLCEYRFYLQEQYGQKDTQASIEGSRLHDIMATPEEITRNDTHKVVPALIIILTLILAYLWIFG